MTDRTQPEPSGSALLSAVEAREYLGGISPQTLYRLVNEHGLPLVKIRRRSFFHRTDLDALIAGSLHRRTPGNEGS
jgi:excisionase family DNA binding protein